MNTLLLYFKKFAFCLSFIFSLVTLLPAQSTYFYSAPNTKTHLDTLPNDWMVYFPNGIGQYLLEESFENQYGNYYTTTALDDLQNSNLSYYASNALTADGGDSKFYESSEVILCFKNSTSETLRIALINQFNLTFIKQEDFYERYRSNDALTDAAAIYETGLVHFSHPNFLLQSVLNNNPPITPNDPYFHKQYYLHNTGQVINENETGVIDADMDVAEAWNLTLGDTSLIVAVIDGGFNNLDTAHPDLPANRLLRPQGANVGAVADNDTSNFNNISGAEHGTNCVGIIAAEHDNGIGISGIAPNTKALPIRFIQGVSWQKVTHYADAYQFANTNGAKIISGSFSILSNNTSTVPFPVVDSAITAAIDNDIVICQAAGNTRNNVIRFGTPLGDTTVLYPATHPNEALICVGASDKKNRQAEYSPNNRHIDVVAPSSSSSTDNDPFFFSSGVLDVWTMGINTELGNNGNPTPLPNSGPDSSFFTGRFGGTSAATPMVAGVTALVRSANPCLDNLQVKKVLLQTADKIGGFNYNWSSEKPGHSLEAGYGKVNALKAVQAAQQMNSSGLDLMIKDVPQDFGYEPDTVAQRLYISEDIWIRNNPDGFTHQWHETPQYAPNTPVYVYVRITNKSCVDALSGDTVKLYWSKAATALDWPHYWDSSLTTPVLMGNSIGVKPIDTLVAGTEKIIVFSWQPPNPSDYNNINPQPWHFCLLARIVSTTDTMSVPEVNTLWKNVRNNNNIAWKNISIVKKTPISGNSELDIGIGAVVAVGNDSPDQQKTIRIRFSEEENAYASIFDDAEIRIKVDNLLLNKWYEGEQQLQDLEYLDENIFLITGNEPELQNLHFNEGERATLHVGFNLLTEEADQEVVYRFYAEQYEGENFIGGEQYLIHRDERSLFFANAGADETVNLGQTVQLRAYLIGEAANYNWYDQNGNLFYTGTDTTFVPQNNETFTLEVIATADGYKDYDEKVVRIRQFYLNNVYPNPIENGIDLTVNYEASTANSAYLTLTNMGTNVSHTVILNLSQSSINIPIQNYTSGTYLLTLICNGQIQDSKTLNIY